MSDPSQLKFTETHEWIRVDGNQGTVGISDHAQKEISDVVFVELPEVGKSVKQKESVAVVESVKAAFDIYAAVSGNITAVNTSVSEKPELLNKSPYDEGWLYRIEITESSELSSLMNYDAYDKHKAAAH